MKEPIQRAPDASSKNELPPMTELQAQLRIKAYLERQAEP